MQQKSVSLDYEAKVSLTELLAATEDESKIALLNRDLEVLKKIKLENKLLKEELKERTISSTSSTNIAATVLIPITQTTPITPITIASPAVPVNLPVSNPATETQITPPSTNEITPEVIPEAPTAPDPPSDPDAPSAPAPPPGKYSL